MTPEVGLTVIPTGACRSEKRRALPSGSVAVTAYAYGCPTVAASGGVEVTTGARFTALADTTTVYVCVAVPPCPSSATTATDCEPTWVLVGVQLTTPVVASMVMP